jgi:hypothetical protein
MDAGSGGTPFLQPQAAILIAAVMLGIVVVGIAAALLLPSLLR